jgi:hypothetical protein
VLGVVLIGPTASRPSLARVALTPGAGVVIEAARNGDVAWLEGACDAHGRFRHRRACRRAAAGSWTASGGGVTLTHSARRRLCKPARTTPEVIVARPARRPRSPDASCRPPGSTEDPHAARTPLSQGAHVGAVPRGLRDLAFVEEVLESTHAITETPTDASR